MSIEELKRLMASVGIEESDNVYRELSHVVRGGGVTVARSLSIDDLSRLVNAATESLQRELEESRQATRNLGSLLNRALGQLEEARKQPDPNTPTKTPDAT